MNSYRYEKFLGRGKTFSLRFQSVCWVYEGWCGGLACRESFAEAIGQEKSHSNFSRFFGYFFINGKSNRAFVGGKQERRKCKK